MSSKSYRPHRVTLASYLIKVRKPQYTKDFLILDQLGTDNFLDFIKAFLTDLQTVSKNDERQKTIKIDTSNFKISTKNRTIKGIIRSGEYGVESDIINSDTGKVVHRRKKEEADERPFYFLIHISENKKEGILILQRTGNLGVVDIINTKIREAFRQKYPDLIIEFHPMITKELANMFVNDGGIRQVVLTKYIQDSDLAEKVLNKDKSPKTKSISLEIKLKAPRGGFLKLKKNVKKFMSDPNARIFSFKGMDSMGFDKDYDASIQVVHNGTTRTVDLSDTGQIRPYYDIDKDLTFDSNGHPTFDSINDSASGLLKDLKSELYPTI